MPIYANLARRRSQGIISSITKQLKLVNLKPVKRINVQFDPFHPNAVTARDFLCHISSPRVTETNLNCIIKGNVVCDRSEPQIKIDLVDSGSIKFLLNKLDVLETIQLINKHISSKVPPEEPVDTIVTKSKKTEGKGKKRR